MENLSDLFVPYKIALILKKKGFNEPCLAIYNNSIMPFIAGNTPVFNDKTEDESIITAPIYQQVVDWFIDKHFIYIHTSLDSYREPYKLVPQIQKMELTRTYVEFEKYYGHFDNTIKGNYEALKKAIEEALKLI